MAHKSLTNSSAYDGAPVAPGELDAELSPYSSSTSDTNFPSEDKWSSYSCNTSGINARMRFIIADFESELCHSFETSDKNSGSVKSLSAPPRRI